MQVKRWDITTEYDGLSETHRASINRFYQEACRLNIYMIWQSGQTTPSNWNGYTASNPSPGRRIDVHVWRLTKEDDAMIFHLLYGSKIAEVLL